MRVLISLSFFTFSISFLNCPWLSLDPCPISSPSEHRKRCFSKFETGGTDTTSYRDALSYREEQRQIGKKKIAGRFRKAKERWLGQRLSRRNLREMKERRRK